MQAHNTCLHRVIIPAMHAAHATHSCYSQSASAQNMPYLDERPAATFTGHPHSIRTATRDSSCGVVQDYRRRFNLEPLVKTTEDEELAKGRKRATVRTSACRPYRCCDCFSSQLASQAGSSTSRPPLCQEDAVYLYMPFRRPEPELLDACVPMRAASCLPHSVCGCGQWQFGLSFV